jgi:hypothetical protein
MKSDFDPEVGMWYECENCNYRDLVSANQPLAPEIQGALNEDFGELYTATSVEAGRDTVKLTPWISADDRVWERYANVTCVECPDCCFRFDAVHQDGDTTSYSCPNCNGDPPSTVTPSEAAREAARELKRDADDMFAMPVDDEPMVTQWAAIISKHCAAEAGEVERLRSIEMLYNAGLKTWNPVYEQILNERNRLRADLAGARTNTISECVEKLNALSTLPFDAVPYIRRDDAVAVLGSLRERGPQQVGQLDT